MKTEIIKIFNSGNGMEEALSLTDSIAEKIGLEKRDSFHLRLLAEEMFSMVRSIAGDFSADFWLEYENRKCKLTLEAKSELDYPKRHELLSVSTRGNNIINTGIMGKIRDFIEAGLYNLGEGLELQNEYGIGAFNYGSPDMIDVGMSEAMFAWSMQKYKSDIEAAQTENSDELDELEKSIIANIADEVQVGVSKKGVILIAVKAF